MKDNGGTPTQGHVLTVDANGEAIFAAASGGGGGGGVTSDAQYNTKLVVIQVMLLVAQVLRKTHYMDMIQVLR